MTAVNIKKNLIPVTASLEVAMRQLDSGVDGVLLCVNDSNVLRGILTDGDVRRAVLRGLNLNDPVRVTMNRDFKFGLARAPREDNLRLLGPVIRHVPILDDIGRPVDILTWSGLWKLPLASPSLAGNELKYVHDCIETEWVSSQGAYIDKFAEAFEQFHKGGKALCTSSGTTALHLALMALGVGEGDEVIVPAITFGASANAVVHSGAKPVFVDIDGRTGTIDVASIEAAISSRTSVIMPVHLYGHPCDMDPILELARRYNLKIVEDCAEALGAEYKGEKVGRFGDIGCYSFFANKVITTGEGGMVLSNDQALIDRMALLRDHGMSKERRYWHEVAGFNYRMTNLQAALGLAQMEQIEKFLRQRQEVVSVYQKNLANLPGINLPFTASYAKNIHWLYSIRVDQESLGIDRDELSQKLRNLNVETRPVFPPLHLQPAYEGQRPGTFPVAETYASQGLSLPTSNGLSLEDAERVCEAIHKVIDDLQ